MAAPGCIQEGRLPTGATAPGAAARPGAADAAPVSRRPGQTRQFAGAPRRGGATHAARDGIRVLGHELCARRRLLRLPGPACWTRARGRGTARARLQTTPSTGLSSIRARVRV